MADAWRLAAARKARRDVSHDAVEFALSRHGQTHRASGGTPLRFRTGQSALRWFDQHLKGIAPPKREAAVRYFVLGENQWREDAAWSPREAKTARWYLHSQGQANSLAGDGQLTSKAPSNAAAEQFVYDPNNPVPTLGGANTHLLPDLIGAKDQRAIEERKDLLVYTSESLRQPLTLAGPMRAVIHAASDATHPDFTAKLVKVRPDGFARLITQGIRRGAVSTTAAPYQIEMGEMTLRLEKGSRLRLEFSSSNFPRYERHPNNSEDPMRTAKFQAAKQTIHHGSRYVSYVELSHLK
ncbi:MAG: CocE/NonD family hydrolase [Acidobacteria bacterium]|nr:CocE/NonD family hydrolase [Acidobacteriota bacterium]